MQKVVLVTGASRGIGRAIAEAFGARAYAVAVNYRTSRQAALEVVETLTAAGGSALAIQADIGDSHQVDRMIQQITDTWSRLDILINNAATTRDRTILKMSDAEWEEVIRSDLTGAFYCLRAAGRVMAKQRSGAIVNISSLVSLRGAVGTANYAAAKAGLLGLSKVAARELGRYQVTVNAVFPGFHFTDLGKTASPDYLEQVKRESVLGKTTQIGDLAEFVVLLSQQTTVSGQIFNWDSRIIG
ncbi:MAG: 3-oxoacyl-ACP reductase FabG [Elusimicrobia bacterium]|nr:3-oxoacyl-ACP reductase FabG [Elusimicrobiota bacterium]